MKPKSIALIAISMALSGCSSMKESVLFGAGTMGTIGAGVGAAAGHNVGSALLGLGIGAVFGGTMGYFGYKDKEEKDRLLKLGGKKSDESKIPSLTSPEVRRIFVPSRIEGQKFIEGHFEYIIERNSVWSK